MSFKLPRVSGQNLEQNALALFQLLRPTCTGVHHSSSCISNRDERALYPAPPLPVLYRAAIPTHGRVEAGEQ